MKYGHEHDEIVFPSDRTTPRIGGLGPLETSVIAGGTTSTSDVADVSVGVSTASADVPQDVVAISTTAASHQEMQVAPAASVTTPAMVPVGGDCH
jgi:hypothetical protein